LGNKSEEVKMPFTVKDIAYGGVMPVIVTAVVVLIVRQCFGSDDRDRHSASVATVVGFLVGYGMLSLAPWSPTAHWHWLPYAVVLAAIVGPVTCVEGVTFVERQMLYVLVALIVGYVLVPEWEDLVPSRNVHLALFVIYVVVLSGLLKPLTKRLVGPLLPVIFWATFTAAAIVLALSGNLRFAQIAIAMAGALFGIVLVAFVRRDENHLMGISLLFSIASVGSLLIGHANSFSEVPFASYLMIPAAPLFAWFGFVGPFAQLSGIKRVFAIATVPVTLLAVAVLMAVIADLGAGGEY
jgi:hypothetical protein